MYANFGIVSNVSLVILRIYIHYLKEHSLQAGCTPIVEINPLPFQRLSSLARISFSHNITRYSWKPVTCKQNVCNNESIPLLDGKDQPFQ